MISKNTTIYNFIYRRIGAIVFLFVMLLQILVQPLYSMAVNNPETRELQLLIAQYRQHLETPSTFLRPESFTPTSKDYDENLSSTVSTIDNINEKGEKEDILEISTVESTISRDVPTAEATVFKADISGGVIGYSLNMTEDDPSDNLFKINIDQDIDIKAQYILKYDLYGLESSAGVTRSINEGSSLGGYLSQPNESWTVQEETLDVNILRKGENNILFTVPSNTFIQYRVKNVRIEKNDNFTPQKIVIDESSLARKDNWVYIRGFVPKKQSNIQIVIAGQVAHCQNGIFEGLFALPEGTEQIVFVQFFEEEELIDTRMLSLSSFATASQLLTYTSPSSKTFLKVPEKESAQIDLGTVGLSIPEEALRTSEILSVQKLRNQDLAPMGASLLNATKEKVGYRFMPDGIIFEKPVKITLEFDLKYLPQGYTGADVQVFYFDTGLKSWTSVPTDTIDFNHNKITAITTHFTDYIAGVIQVPESPETSSFVPTSISDIQIANPAQNIIEIQPPTANPQGDANLEFPIEMPPGRNGMQPDLSVRYSSGGGNGWMGQGWDLSVPYIEVDTRWGVPIFDGQKETESYTLSGDNLLLYKGDNDLYAPHKSSLISRVNNVSFVPQVEGDFKIIKRYGNSPSSYYWVVTDKKTGRTYYYGGSDNSRLKTDDGHIVRWMLDRVEEIDENYMEYKYELKNYTEGVLKGGRQLYLDRIFFSQHPLCNI